MDDLTLPQLHALLEYWDRVPPLHVSMALFAGTMKSPTKTKGETKVSSKEDIEAFAAMFGM